MSDSVGTTSLLAYLNFISNWEHAVDGDVQQLIEEQKLFKELGDYQSDTAVDHVIDHIIHLAKKVRDETISADAVQISADAAAVSSFWSFGMSMAAFASLEATEAGLRADISKKSKELNKKLESCDTDIGSSINQKVHHYIAKYKANNSLITAYDVKGFSLRECRSDLMQFMAEVDTTFKHKGGLTVNNFKQMAASARKAFNAKQIEEVTKAIDKLHLSTKSINNVQDFINILAGFQINDQHAVQIVQGFSLALAASSKIKVAKTTLQECAKTADIPVAEVSSEAFEMMDACGKFAAGVVIIISVVDAVFNVLDIKDVAKQYKHLVDELNHNI
ncbi:uncharacterized protein [Clytia hemisphaerica]|uniref:Uncharacterized protein n=1 Tax=Clytia hemisphaerica TaxID=252671 RepID=A0A7M6DPV9_9CNID